MSNQRARPGNSGPSKPRRPAGRSLTLCGLGLPCTANPTRSQCTFSFQGAVDGVETMTSVRRRWRRARWHGCRAKRQKPNQRGRAARAQKENRESIHAAVRREARLAVAQGGQMVCDWRAQGAGDAGTNSPAPASTRRHHAQTVKKEAVPLTVAAAGLRGSGRGFGGTGWGLGGFISCARRCEKRALSFHGSRTRS